MVWPQFWPVLWELQFYKFFHHRGVAQLVARLVWEREQGTPLWKNKKPEKPCNIGILGTLQNLKIAWKSGLTTVCPTSTQKQWKSNKNRGVAQLVERVVWELKVATRSPLQKSEKTREKRRKNEHLPFDLPSQKWFDHNFDQFCENYNFISFFTIEV